MRTGSLRNRFFGAFEGTRSAYPIAIFRVAFFGGLALHFFPALVHLDDDFTPGALRSDEWNHWLYMQVQHIPMSTMRLWSVVTIVACATSIAGVLPRLAVVTCGLGFYAFASFNGFPVQTLALVNAWAVLLAWMICGGGTEALSIDALLARRRGATRGSPRAPKLLSGLVLFQVLLAVFFSGVEKLLAGWPWTNEMGILLSYPRGFVVREWVASTDWLHASLVTHALTWMTPIIEIGTPVLLAVGTPRLRLGALLVFEAFFVGIVAMLQVPPLFYFIFAFGALLALDDDQVQWVADRLTRSRRGVG
jgi:hypothetical protein